MVEIVKGWELLSDVNSDKLWEKVDEEFNFTPNYHTKNDVFTLDTPYDLYDCSNVAVKADTDIKWAETIREIFSKVMGEDEYMYALDWQHPSFKYNPKVDRGDVNKAYIVKDAVSAYNVYLPRFYPDGEYFLFIAQDFKWGYLTAPWRNHIFVYGDELRDEMNKRCEFLGLLLIS